MPTSSESKQPEEFPSERDEVLPFPPHAEPPTLIADPVTTDTRYVAIYPPLVLEGHLERNILQRKRGCMYAHLPLSPSISTPIK